MDIYRHIFNHSEDALLLLEGEKVLNCSRRLCELWGALPDSNLIGMTLSSLLLPDATSSHFLLERLRRFIQDRHSTSVSFESEISALREPACLARIKLDKLTGVASSLDQNKGAYTLVSIKPLNKHDNWLETVKLGDNSMSLSVGSLVNFVTELFEDFPVGIAINDLDTGKFVAANNSFLLPLQYSLSELQGVSFDEITPPEYMESDYKALELLHNTGSFSAYKKEYICKDQSRIFVKLYGGAVLDTSHKKYVWSFIENITEAENIKRRLSDQINLMNFASHQTQTGVWELDLESGRLEWSDEVYRIFEIDKTQFGASYEAFLGAIHPVDREWVHEAYQNSLIDKAPYEIVHRLLMPDGRIKYVNERCTTTFDDRGTPLVSIGTIQDITSANQSRTEMERCPILNASQDFIVIANLDGRVTFINPAGRDMIGMSSDLDRETWLIRDLYVEENQELLEKEVMPALSSSGKWRGDLLLKKIGSEGSVWVDCDAFRVDNPVTGEPICFAAVSQNITERRSAELELQAYKESLEQRVIERTIALEEANYKAEQANKAKSAFLSRMSHELRTPLNAMLGFSQLVMEGLEGSQQDSQLENINEVIMAGGNLLTLINEILDISLIEKNGRIRLKRDKVNLDTALNQAVRALSSSLEQKNVHLERECFEDLLIQGDANRVTQVIQNVLSNAIKFNEQGGRVEVYSVPSREGYYCLAVKDTGIGIGEENISRILEPFERVNNDLYEGTGIGLTLVKELIDLMEGSLRLESTLGSGTCVYLEFKLVTSGQLPLSHSEDLSISTSKADKKLLYIEDVSANMKLMRRIMSKIDDVQLLEASCGQEGIETAAAHQPDLILLDINLPDMNGHDVLSVLRSLELTKHIPVIAISANAFPSDIEHALKSGFDEYVVKPFEHELLLNKVNFFLATQ